MPVHPMPPAMPAGVPPRPDLATKPRVPWGPKSALAVYFMAGGASLFTAILVHAVPGLKGPGGEAVGGFLLEATLLLIAVWWIRSFEDGNLHVLGYPPARPLTDIGMGLGFGALAVIADIVAAVIVSAIVRAITGHPPAHPPTVLRDMQGAWAIPVAFVAVVMAPLGEETLFRGFVLQGLENGFSPARAIVISAALFAFVHVYPVEMPSIFAIGILLAVLFRRRRSLLASMTAHGTVNLTVVLLTYASRH
jgi:membrane protease YdiL (CAAX protease family)